MLKRLFTYSVLLINLNIGLIAQTELKSINIIFTNGSENYKSGNSLKIEWKSQNISKINIYYLDDKSNQNIIVSNIDALENNFIWEVPENISENIKIKIEDFQDSTIYSELPFSLNLKSKENILFPKNIAKIDNVSTVTVKKIMPLGDSITQGYISDNLNKDGYRKKLKTMLNNNGLNIDLIGSLSDGTFDDFEHEGHGGYSAKHWSGYTDLDLYTHLTTFLTDNPPDFILFHIGTNDINDFSWSNDLNVANTTVSDVNSNLNLIYNFNPNIKVILAKIINRIDNINTPTLNESIATSQFNTALANMAIARPEYGTKLFLVDMENVLSYPTDLFDGLHPNINGYEKMSPVWFNGILSILPKLNVKVFLEGSYSGLSNMATNSNFFETIPIDQPFNQFPWSYNGTEHVDDIPSGIIDWVLVSLRESTLENSIKAYRAGFLKENGTIVDLDGTSPLAFVVDEGMYYVVVEHRNHLPVMSANKINITP
ncbi:MAG: GDSL-type esterase/lipase family protein [Melioribacteraceae bacterium]